MRILWDYMIFIYSLMMLIGFFELLNNAAIEFCHDELSFWFSILLILGGAVGFSIVSYSYHKLKR